MNNKYKKAMKVGHIINTEILSCEGMDDIIPGNWSDSEEIAKVCDFVSNEVTFEEILNGIEEVKKIKLNDQDWVWDDNARGLIAGYYFGMPTDESLKLAEQAEKLWNDDNGEYGYYHEVCSEVKKRKE
ncbi:MAG: hypothetical protein K6G30_03930 [Acetatifactor sp.]|nr:hypothetical protein [Acetatifactor sp.]